VSRAGSFPPWPEAVAALQAYVPSSRRDIDAELAQARVAAFKHQRKLLVTGLSSLLAAVVFLTILGPIFDTAGRHPTLEALGVFLRVVSLLLGLAGAWLVCAGERSTKDARFEKEVHDRHAPARGADLVIVNDLLTSASEAREIVRGWVADGSRLSVEDVQTLLRTYDAWLAERTHLYGVDASNPNPAAISS
jgi:hypothetical protein